MNEFVWLLVLASFIGPMLGLIGYFFARAFDTLWGDRDDQ